MPGSPSTSIAIRRARVLAAFAFLTACTGGSTSSVAGGAPECSSDADCDDAVFCNGTERCSAGTCQAGLPACADETTCNEPQRRCEETCPDADGDGARAIACGGTDCDDTDARRAPGNTEVCDAFDLDEDCNPETFGSLNADGDGFVSDVCCNVDAGGTRRCGTDCDDRRADINPETSEICDGEDNDCDTRLDEEGEPVEWYPDGDGDLFGNAAADAVLSCGQPDPVGGVDFVVSGTDCDDARASVNPGNPEVRGNGLDDNCNGRIDEGATRLSRGGIQTLGGTRAHPDRDARISDARIETYSRSCRDGDCIIGGILP